MNRILSILILGYLAYLVFTTSCANPGMPAGGDKDSIPPVVVKTLPGMNARMYEEQTVNITFDEFVIADEVSSKLVVSPPLEKKPLVKTKSKTLIVDLGTELKPNTTYSLDFKDAIADNNEKNPLENFRFSFSTGEAFDTLEVGGYVRLAENMEPIGDILVVLHVLDSLSAFRDSIPNYIAKTDEEGFFLISNVAAGNYRLYAIEDADNSLTFNQPGEMIAFYDSLVVPQFPVSAPLSADSLLAPAQFNSKPFYLLLYAEEVFDQFLDNSKRDRANLCNFYFSESLTDSFQLNLLSPTPTPNWAQLEFGTRRDTVSLWINDTILSKSDTLKFELKYQVHDSLKNLVMTADTVELVYKQPEQKERKRRPEKEAVKVQHFTFKQNARDPFDVYNPLRIEAPEPLAGFDLSKVALYQLVDTVEQRLDVALIPDTTSKRKFRIDYPWEFEEQYRVEIDSAAAYTYSGQPSSRLNQKFKIQKEGYYAKIILAISNLPGNSMVQLLKNTDKEELVLQTTIRADGEIEFPFLKPEKYKIRLIVDRNDNGRWDTGSIEEWKQPERVVYYPKILKLRSNFEVRESWALPADIQYGKELIDEDQDAKDAKRTKGKKPAAGTR
ncbi:MAG: Ig-like domain-containing domain [Mangrovibacterium sp.]